MVSKLINEKVFISAENGLKNLSKFGKIAIKLKAIVACKTNNISKVAAMFNISRTSLTGWLKAVHEAGIDELFVKPGRGKAPLVATKYHQLIKEWLQKNPNLTIDNVQQMIYEKLDIKIGRTATYNLIQKLNLSYITPRPKHYKSNPEEQKAFKKSSKNNIKRKRQTSFIF